MFALTTSQPGTLIPRTDTDSILVLLLLTVCITLVALARAREKQLFVLLLQGVFGFGSLEDLSSDFYKPRSFSFILTVVLFMLTSAGAVYWVFFLREPLANWQELLIPVFLPSGYFIYQLLMSNIVASVSGERQSIDQASYYSLLVAQFFGLVLLLELIISYFQPKVIVGSTWVFGITYLLYLLLRLLRGFFITARSGVSWYYIILYFWTLEILPLLIVSKLLLVR